MSKRSAGREHAGGSPTVHFESHTDEEGAEESVPVPAIDFDWDAVYAQDEPAAPIPVTAWTAEEFPVEIRRVAQNAFEQGREEGRRQAEEMLHRLLRWADANGRGTFSGMANRTAVLQWFYNPDYSNFLQTELLLRYGLENKQLLNRETVAFRDHFGQLDSRFYSEKARQVYRRREACKRRDRECAPVAEARSGD